MIKLQHMFTVAVDVYSTLKSHVSYPTPKCLYCDIEIEIHSSAFKMHSFPLYELVGKIQGNFR